MKIVILLNIITVILYANQNLDILITKAKKGDVGAISKLAYIYENGIGVKKDINKAFKLYQKASQMGDEDSKLALTLIELENSVNKSVSKKNIVTVKDKEFLFQDISKDDIKELIKKAKNRDKDALFALGVLYDNGYGVINQNKQKAISLYKKAYKLGSKKAKDILKLKKVIK